MIDNVQIEDTLSLSSVDSRAVKFDSDSIIAPESADSVAHADSIKLIPHKEIPHPGIDGTPMPYRIQSDNGITGVLFFCFFLTAYVLSQGKKVIFQQIKDLAHTRERASIFTVSTAAYFRYRLLLLFQTCILLGLCFFDYFYDSNPLLIEQKPSYLVLLTSIFVCTVYLFLKWQLYRFLGWVFFDKIKIRIWLESYSIILYYLGFALFPLVLLTVYFDLSSNIIIPCAIGLVIIAKILMFYKWLKLFFNGIHGILYLIVYFCALELMPSLILYQGFIYINNLLLTKQ